MNRCEKHNYVHSNGTVCPFWENEQQVARVIKADRQQLMAQATERVRADCLADVSKLLEVA